MKHILMVGRSREIFARSRGLDVRFSLILVGGASRTAEDLSGYQRVIVLPPDASVEEWLQCGQLINTFDPIDAIGGFTETAEKIAVDMAERLALPFHGRDVIHTTHDKFAMRERLRSLGIDDTASRIVAADDEASIREFAAEHGCPVVIKPLSARGSLGVSVVKSLEELPAALAWFRAWAGGQPVLVEKFLAGEEWSVEAFSEGGVHRIMCITRKFKSPQTCIETGHCLPAIFEEGARQRIHALVKSTLDAVGLQCGPSHTEVMMCAEGPRVIETHTRLGGDRIAEMIALLGGADPYQLWVRQVAGESVLPEVPVLDGSAFASIQFTSPSCEGVLDRIEGLEQAISMPGVVRADAMVAPGQRIGAVHDSFSRGASVLARASTAEEAVLRAQEAVAAINFIVS
ncbi:hypothetical protein XBLMG947_3674 [Xanthomonas bromi]|uniref:ATP-grasp domain-containing protein n=1 Tax=Xanthomonas bromi TaxID=56449 RepID=A0A1C3NR39_9XANT|nr:ATP-grasp domain-containing protein [Xanthomonas bromi]PPV05201.1 hypothetical protein XbrCFBP1976_18415 [Xanthomonas bromi]SBV52873.1 hypothetical protein XBLMG947_3674 [Xanthomonas bromi]